MPDLAFASVARLSELIGECVVDPVELTRLFLSRAKGVGKPLNAYVMLREDEALAEASAARARTLAGKRLGPLDGIPIGLKDNIDVAGSPTTNGFGGTPNIPKIDADVTHRLKASGAVLLGKLNMHEAALGGTTDNPHHGRTHNPYRIGFSPGGSSGGSGAAVAAGLCAAALGTDTAGSIRLPASYCGVAGLKPTAHRVSLKGVVPLSRRLDHIGPLARTTTDLGIIMGVLAGRDPRWTPAPTVQRLDGRTICVLENFLNEAVLPEVAVSFDQALRQFEALGARIAYKTLPSCEPEVLRFALFLMVEAGAAFEHGSMLDQDRARVSETFARCVRYGQKMMAVDLLHQESRVAPAAAEMLACFADADVIASPTTPQPAFSFDQAGLTNLNTFSTLANITGCPAVSLPMGMGPSGLPHGLQLMGPIGQDESLLALAGAYEAAAGWRLTPPAPFGL